MPKKTKTTKTENPAPKTWDERAKEIGSSAMGSIRDMVAALECDYDRLEELRDERDAYEPEDVPDDHEVKILEDDDEAEDRATCETCGRSWDDAISTSCTPTPAGRCPFEDYHNTTWAQENPDDAEELAELEEAAGECESREDAEERIQEDPLSLQFRSGWASSKEEFEAEEFELLLTTGGPAVRIIGEISGGQPTHPRLQVQDWGTSWTDYYESGIGETLEKYCAVFYMGD